MNLDYRGLSNVGRIGDKCCIHVKCDNCGARYFIMEDNPDVPRLHRVCDTCFMPMVVKNWFYLWKRLAKEPNPQKRMKLIKEFEEIV
ncbi:MAG: hypothetical protein IKB97_05845 [Bacteroidaceae bacterium]|nr:hypothetical protein [Fibrobacter sp.]MBR2863063.1 hypothetical protein [Bacteroidaceae bacterium]MBR6317265.1 hypothetical protein [Fibrobacter sp.]